MAQPPVYTIATDFSADESSNLTGRSTVRTANLDTELTNIQAFVSAMRSNIALIQADDGTIKDDAVDLPTLADDVINWISTNGNGWFASDTGAVNAMVVTLSPAPSSLTNGMFVVSDMKLTNTSTSVTLNVNGLGAKTVVTDGAGTAPSIGSLTIGTFYGFQYDSSADKFQIVFSGDSLTHSTSASASATAAAASATAAATSFDNFDDRFLGAKSGSDPSVDNDGDALIDGALMFRTDEAVMKVYDLSSTTWLRTTPSTSDQTKINTVSGIASDVTAVAGKATEIGRLGTADAVADMAILGTADVVTDMNVLATADVVADMNTLGTADVVTDMNVLGTADVVADMNTLGTADVVADMNTLGTADVVSDMNTLGTADVVSDMNTLATSANVTAMGLLGNATTVSNMGLLGTSAVVTDLGILATADVVSDMNTLATADVVSDLNTLGTADVVSDMNTLGTGANVTAMANCSANLASINSYADTYTVSSSAPGSPSEGDLWYDSSNNVLKCHNGTSFVAVTSATVGIASVADDSTPQLGGNLDLQTYTLSNVSLANGGFYSNPNTITGDATVTTAALKNMFLMGQISVNDTYTWTIAGDGVLSII